MFEAALDPQRCIIQVDVAPLQRQQRASDLEFVVAAFLRIADRVQARTGRDRVAALQRACSEHPLGYEQYLKAIQEGDGK